MARRTRMTTRTPTHRPVVRMYRQGLGDCFLIKLATGRDRPFTILIDCGVILGTPAATETMTKVMEDVVAETGGKLDLLVGTHEHWDHLSGFVQARDAFDKLTVDTVWLGWTEDPNDPKARALIKERHELVNALRLASSRLAMGGDGLEAARVDSLLSFFGTANSTRDALEAIRKKSDKVVYKRPSDPPFRPEGTDVEIFVLGPPLDERMLKKHSPSRSHPETYELDGERQFLSGPGQGLLANTDGPFDYRFGLPIESTRAVPFFRERYWDEPADVTSGDGLEDRENGWRRADTAWLEAAPELALKLDSATNNTSLALAIRLSNGDVMLFAADAQVGSWLSWQSLKWTVNDQQITGPQLLADTVLYKGGHHLSHNATLKKDGLERMVRLKYVLAPVDEVMAKKKGWHRMPLPSLLAELQAKAEVVIRPDQQPPSKPYLAMAPNGLWCEVTV